MGINFVQLQKYLTQDIENKEVNTGKDVDGALPCSAESIKLYNKLE